MLKGIICLAFIAMAGSLIKAQDYRAVYPGRVALYSNDYDIVGLRIDSTGWDGDSFFVPNPMIRIADIQEENCFTPNGASWIGEKIIEKKNGYTCFINFLHDSVKIKINAQINESWTMYDADSMIFKATAISCDTMSFLGITDSVKRISIQVTDDNDIPIENDLNNKIMLLSKHYGLVRTFHLYFFPYWTAESGDMFITSRHLAGIDKPQLGMKNITWWDINDFQPGDVLHILDVTVTDFGQPERKTSTIKHYLNRQDYADSIIYTVDIITQIERNDTVAGYSRDTITERYETDTLFDKLPGEPIYIDYTVFSFEMTTTSKIMPSFYEFLSRRTENCWAPVTADGCFPEKQYLKGLGGPYGDCNGAFGGSAETKLVYYKKGSTTWGTPVTITAVEDPPEKGNIEVFPNPAGGVFYIKSNDARFSVYTISVLNLQGQVVYTNDHYSDRSPVNVKGLSGTNIVRITTPEGVVMRKIVVE